MIPFEGYGLIIAWILEQASAFLVWIPPALDKRRAVQGEVRDTKVNHQGQNGMWQEY